MAPPPRRSPDGVLGLDRQAIEWGEKGAGRMVGVPPSTLPQLADSR
jgi:hypothetical protein